NINQTNFTGNTALSYADISVMPLLVARADLNINQQDAGGNTALLKEIKNYFVDDEENNLILDKITILLDAGADPELTNNKGHTPLQAAEETGDPILIDLIKNKLKYFNEEQ